MLQPKGISQCYCDTFESTCSDCMLRGWAKPFCGTCHKDVNNGVCSKDCKKPNWLEFHGCADNKDRIVKHTEAEKKIIRGWERDRVKMLEEATAHYNQVWQGKECRDCKKEFSTRGGKLDTCKECTLLILNDKDKYKEERGDVKVNF